MQLDVGEKHQSDRLLDIVGICDHLRDVSAIRQILLTLANDDVLHILTKLLGHRLGSKLDDAIIHLHGRLSVEKRE